MIILINGHCNENNENIFMCSNNLDIKYIENILFSIIKLNIKINILFSARIFYLISLI